MEPSTLDSVRSMLREFVDGTDRSTRRAGEIEVAIDDAFPDDPRFESIVDALARYSPTGGAFLLGEEEIAKWCAHALTLLD